MRRFWLEGKQSGMRRLSFTRTSASGKTNYLRNNPLASGLFTLCLPTLRLVAIGCFLGGSFGSQAKCQPWRQLWIDPFMSSGYCDCQSLLMLCRNSVAYHFTISIDLNGAPHSH